MGFSCWTRASFTERGVEHAGFIVTVNHHDFWGNDISYDILEVGGSVGTMFWKNLPSRTVHGVPSGLRLEDGLRNPRPAADDFKNRSRLFIAEAADDGSLQLMLDAYQPGFDAGETAVGYRNFRFGFSKALERLDFERMPALLAEERKRCETYPEFQNGMPPIGLFDTVMNVFAWASGDPQKTEGDCPPPFFASDGLRCPPAYGLVAVDPDTDDPYSPIRIVERRKRCDAYRKVRSRWNRLHA